MAIYKCILCDQERDDDIVEVKHYGLKSACELCAQELLDNWDKE